MAEEAKKKAGHRHHETLSDEEKASLAAELDKAKGAVSDNAKATKDFTERTISCCAIQPPSKPLEQRVCVKR